MHEAPGSDPRIVEEVKKLREEVDALKAERIILKCSEAEVLNLVSTDVLFLHVDVEQWQAGDVVEVVGALRKRLGVKDILVMDRGVEVTVGKGSSVLKGPRPGEAPWCSPLSPCTPEKCKGGPPTCYCSCHNYNG